ncbi:MAG: TaqI-like C-terminal specificity domain-containing protein [bacterium]
MDRQTAINLIANTFNHPFNEDKFRHFIRNLLNDVDESGNFEYYGRYIPDSFKEHIRKYKRVGKYADPKGKELDVIIVHLKRETALDRARTMQRNFIAWYLKNRGEKDAAVVAYHTDTPDDWRFSYVRVEYKQETTESGKVKVKEELTPARRYSFLVGKNEPTHTAQQQLISIFQDDRLNPSLADLEKAFSVEAVTRQFYEDYKGLYEKLTQELNSLMEEDGRIKKEFETKSIDTANFAKKLLGQIVFLYFLQKKGWLGVGKNNEGSFKPWGTGQKNFLRLLFEKQFINYHNFFNDVLEPLFYEALATERANDFYSPFNCKIPFLNGGLFEPINEYDWQQTDIFINHELFTEIFDTFDRYNFTVREDEPLEKEVAVDPEMLGKVFENLLPENLRKGQGAYYTPREIVHYMCQESLINYLDTAVNTGEVSLAQTPPTQGKLFGKPDPEQMVLKTTGYKPLVPREDIEEFIRKGEFAVEHDIAKEKGTKTYKYQVPESIRKNAKLLDDKLTAIKICDPAIGSGAFPVGMMHEIVKARNVLTTYIEDSKERSADKFKRHCIQESLYGVDIDPGAIEIAKLRLWLSLMVDEDDYYAIKPLPNLDYKIMQGNSLIEDFHGISLNIEKKEESQGSLFDMDSELDRLIEDLHHKQNALFNATHPSDKKEQKEEVENAIVKIFHYELQRQKEPYFRELKNIKESARRFKEEEQQKIYDIEKVKLDKKYNFDFETVENELREMTHGNKVRNFFPWKLYFADVFRQKGGFDVVIANPPYIFARESKKKGLSNEDKGYFYEHYELAEYQVNLYPLFIEKGTYLLRANGCFCFITPNNWLTINTNRRLRKFVLGQSDITIVNFYARVFESAAVDSAIIIFRKSVDNRHVALYEYTDDFRFIKEAECGFFLSHRNHVINIEAFKGGGISEVMEKIERGSVKLAQVADVKAGLKAYEIGKGNPPQTNEMKTDRVYHSTRKIDNSYIKYLDGKDVCRYYLDWTGEYLKYGNNLAAPRKDFRLYSTSRILVRQIPAKPPYCIHACLIEETALNDLNSMNIINIRESPECVLGILNSRLTSFWFIHKFGKMQRGTFPQFKVNELADFPLPKNRAERSDEIAKLVSQILSLKKSDPQADTRALEAEIDRLVYDLYGLTEEEIAIVEGSVRR